MVGREFKGGFSGPAANPIVSMARRRPKARARRTLPGLPRLPRAPHLQPHEVDLLGLGLLALGIFLSFVVYRGTAGGEHGVVVSASYAVVGRWRESYDDLDHARADELLDSLAIGNLADRTFGTLSEGERKRVQIARALMTDPELLLLDEPSAGLDLTGRETLLRTLGSLASDPYAPASVLVTHHVEEIPVGVTHVLLLKRGRVVAAGPVETTLTAQRLQETFDLEVELTTHNGRWSAQAR